MYIRHCGGVGMHHMCCSSNCRGWCCAVGGATNDIVKSWVPFAIEVRERHAGVGIRRG